MKKYNKSVKFLTHNEFFKYYLDFIRVSEKGIRTRKNGKRLSSRTTDKYHYTYKLLVRFCEEKKFEMRLYLLNHLTENEIARAKKYWRMFYMRFTDFLYNDLKHVDNYVGTSLKNIKAFMNYLNNEVMMNVGQFHKQFHIPSEEIPIVVISPEQLRTLIYDQELEEQLNPHLRVIKDIFVFGCTVALRFSDLMALQPFHVHKQEANYYLKIKSQKTGTESRIKLPDYALEILKRYGGKQPTLLPKFSLDYFNSRLKEIGRHLAMEEPMMKVRSRRGKECCLYKNTKRKQHYTTADQLSSHTMRRTAITTMLRLGMNEQAVRRISGHAPGSKEFYRYVAYSQTFLDSETDRLFDRLKANN